MRKIIGLLLMLLPVCHLQSQDFSIKTFGQQETDRGVGIERALEGNGFVMVGMTESFNAEIEDVYIVKTDSEGQIIWQNTIGGEREDNGWVIKQTLDNHYIIAGFSNSFGSDDWDIYLIKIAPNGQEVWSKTFGGNNDQFAWDLLVTPENHYIIIGQTNDTDNGEVTSLLMKVDDTGSLIWKEQLENQNLNRAFSIVSGEAGSLFFTGLIATKNGSLDGFIAKADDQGVVEWIKTYGGPKNDLCHTIRKSGDGHLLLIGYSKSYGTANNSPWLVKVDQAGKEIWNYTYGSQAEERIVSAYVTEKNQCILLGYIFKQSPEGRHGDLLLLQVDSMGNIEWLKTYGGPKDEEAGQTILMTEDGELVFTGRTFSRGAGEGDLFLVKVKIE